jgi:hypothetical protein
MTITERAKEILLSFPQFCQTPTSLSGKYHHGETHLIHAEETANAMRHLCIEFNIPEADRDLLIAACYLHDIGLTLITVKGKTNPSFKYFEATDYSRNESKFDVHAMLSAEVILGLEIERKDELMRLVSVHMSHWHPKCPQPQNLYEYLICIADYVVTYGSMKKFEERFK